MRDLLSECLAGSEDTHPCGARGDARLRGVFFDRDAVHLDALQRFGILGPQAGSQLPNAAANRCVRLRAGFGSGSELGLESLQCLESRSAAPPLVDHGISKRSIKPRDGGFIATKLVHMAEATFERVLQNVFCSCPVADLSF